MMRPARAAIIGTLAGIALAAGIAAYAVGSGGFPSRPWLQSLGVGTPPQAAAGGISTSGAGFDLFGANPDNAPSSASGIDIGSEGGTAAGLPAVYWIRSGGAADEKVWGCKSSLLVNDDFACFTSHDAGLGFAAAWVDVTRSGLNISGVNFPNGALETAGAQFALGWGSFSVTASVCALVSATSHQGISGCTRNGTGAYTVTFSKTDAGFSFLECTATMASAGPFFVGASSPNNSSVNITEYNAAGAVADAGTFSVSCN